MTLTWIAKRVIPMSVQNGIKARGILGRWRGASKAHTRSGLQRASNPKDKRIGPDFNGIWNLHGSGWFPGEPAAQCEKKMKICDYVGPVYRLLMESTMWNKNEPNYGLTPFKIILLTIYFE